MHYVDALPVGTEVGSYAIESVLGQGGFGIVYRARHPIHGRVALKEFFPKSQASRVPDGTIVPSTPRSQEAFAKGVERLLSEGAKLKGFKHRNIVRVIDVFEQNRTAYLVMEEVDGPTLQGAVEGRSLVPNKAMVEDFANHMLDALALVHSAGLIHRDVAPDNILVDTRSGAPRFVLIDFGGAKRIVTDISESSSRQLTKTGFSSPEQYGSESEGGVKATPATDVYGLAATLYWLISGNKPVDAPNRSIQDTLVKLSSNNAWVQTYGRNFLSGIDHGLTLRPSGRPAGAEAFRKALLEGWKGDQVESNSKWPLTVGLLLLAGLGAWLYASQIKPPGGDQVAEEQARIDRIEAAEQALADKAAVAEARRVQMDADAQALADKIANETAAAEARRVQMDADAQALADKIVNENLAAAQALADKLRLEAVEKPPCTPTYDQQQKCRKVYRTERVCVDESDSDLVSADGTDVLLGQYPSVEVANNMCRSQAKQRLRPELKQKCRRGQLGSIDVSCECQYDRNSPTGASCYYEASADCEKTKEVCRNEQVPDEVCEVVNVPLNNCG